MLNGSQKELAPRRLDNLRELIRGKGVIRVEEICQPAQGLARHGAAGPGSTGGSRPIRRVHGGAVSVESRLEEPLFDDKASLAAREKHRIAEAALQFVEAGDTIYLDGGSTVLELARLLHDRTNLTVVTNSLRAAQELAGRGPRLILIGGELRRLSQTMVGPLTRLHPAGIARGQGVHGHHRADAEGRLDDDRSERGLHQGAGDEPGAAGDSAGRFRQGRQSGVRARRAAWNTFMRSSPIRRWTKISRRN